ncbi:MAG: thiamine phosphate synthase [Pseudomonadota bacterium]|jgi:thiamine-phosphate pyrophosphorylase|nr:thiamine phosphate synthase [Pseudomonadota bacterium]
MSEPQRERPRLYLITPPQIEDVPAFVDLFRAAIQGGDVASLQIRLKQGDQIDPIATRAVAQAVKRICQAEHIALIINDSPQLARALEADGVHLGMNDMDIAEARAIVGEDMIIGATCKNSRHQAMIAGEAGADYVAFGAFYPSETKSDTTPAEPDVLTWCQMFLTLPCVAIGGITLENAAPLVSAGADFLAVSNGVWNHNDGPAAAVAMFNRVIDEAMVSSKV